MGLHVATEAWEKQLYSFRTTTEYEQDIQSHTEKVHKVKAHMFKTQTRTRCIIVRLNSTKIYFINLEHAHTHLTKNLTQRTVGADLLWKRPSQKCIQNQNGGRLVPDQDEDQITLYNSRKRTHAESSYVATEQQMGLYRRIKNWRINGWGVPGTYLVGHLRSPDSSRSYDKAALRNGLQLTVIKQ